MLLSRYSRSFLSLLASNYMPKSQIPLPPRPHKTSTPPIPQTKIGRITSTFMTSISEPIHLIGSKMMGLRLWKMFYLSVQDIIALSCLSKVSSWLYPLITGVGFHSFKQCIDIDSLSPDRYGCFIIVAWDMCGWIILAGRLIGRFWADLIDLRK